MIVIRILLSCVLVYMSWRETHGGWTTAILILLLLNVELVNETARKYNILVDLIAAKLSPKRDPIEGASLK
jgi:hypothetical protein